jgi:hypothetical protein
MNFEQFKLTNKVYLENCPFELTPLIYRLTIQAPEDIEVITHVSPTEFVKSINISDTLLKRVFHQMMESPYNVVHHLNIGYFKYLIDSICGEDTYHPHHTHTGSTYFLPRKLTDFEYASFLPFMEMIDVGPNVLLKRRSKIPIRQRQVLTN